MYVYAVHNCLNFHGEVRRKVNNLTSETALLLEYRLDCSIAWLTWELWGRGARLLTLGRLGFELPFGNVPCRGR